MSTFQRHQHRNLLLSNPSKKSLLSPNDFKSKVTKPRKSQSLINIEIEIDSKEDMEEEYLKQQNDQLIHEINNLEMENQKLRRKYVEAMNNLKLVKSEVISLKKFQRLNEMYIYEKMQLLDQNQKINMDLFEIKQKYDQLKIKYNALQNKYIDLKSSFCSEVNKTEQLQTTQKDELRLKYDKSQKNNYQNQSKIKYDETEINDMVQTLQIEHNRAMNKMHEELKDYQNEMEYKRNMLQKTLTNLKIRYFEKLINCDWRSWSDKDIIIWIVNLNKDKYEKYGVTLFANMRKEGINGCFLKHLNMNDLYRFGIHNSKDMEDIYQEIQKLITNKNKRDNVNNHCIVCMYRSRDYAFIPCGHLCLCWKCKDNLDQKCLVCKKKYDSVIKIFR